MKIGIDARMYGKEVSGLGTYIEQLVSHLIQIDQDNDYYLFLLEPNYSHLKIKNQNVKKIKTTSKWYTYQEQTSFLKLINSYDLDLMHFPNFNAPILYNKPRIHTIHDITPMFFPGHKQKSWWRKYAYNITLKTALKKSQTIITDSLSTKNDLVDHFELTSAKIEITYLGIESRFKVIEKYDKIKELKEQFQITKPFIFYISAWRSHKNFEGLIEAFNLLKSKFNLDIQLVLGGQEDPYYPNINQQINKSNYKKDIITTGFITEEKLPLFYNAAEIYVIPSFYEGFGITGLEAMACGKPVISSNKTSLPEILGSAALYFDPQDIRQMAEKIYQVLTDKNLQRKLITQGFEQIKKYSWTECAQKTLKIYQQILNNPHAKKKNNPSND